MSCRIKFFFILSFILNSNAVICNEKEIKIITYEGDSKVLNVIHTQKDETPDKIKNQKKVLQPKAEEYAVIVETKLKDSEDTLISNGTVVWSGVRDSEKVVLITINSHAVPIIDKSLADIQISIMNSDEKVSAKVIHDAPGSDLAIVELKLKDAPGWVKRLEPINFSNNSKTSREKTNLYSSIDWGDTEKSIDLRYRCYQNGRLEHMEMIDDVPYASFSGRDIIQQRHVSQTHAKLKVIKKSQIPVHLKYAYEISTPNMGGLSGCSVFLGAGNQFVGVIAQRTSTGNAIIIPADDFGREVCRSLTSGNSEGKFKGSSSESRKTDIFCRAMANKDTKKETESKFTVSWSDNNLTMPTLQVSHQDVNNPKNTITVKEVPTLSINLRTTGKSKGGGTTGKSKGGGTTGKSKGGGTTGKSKGGGTSEQHNGGSDENELKTTLSISDLSSKLIDKLNGEYWSMGKRYRLHDISSKVNEEGVLVISDHRMGINELDMLRIMGDSGEVLRLHLQSQNMKVVDNSVLIFNDKGIHITTIELKRIDDFKSYHGGKRLIGYLNESSKSNELINVAPEGVFIEVTDECNNILESLKVISSIGDGDISYLRDYIDFVKVQPSFSLSKLPSNEKISIEEFQKLFGTNFKLIKDDTYNSNKLFTKKAIQKTNKNYFAINDPDSFISNESFMNGSFKFDKSKEIWYGDDPFRENKKVIVNGDQICWFPVKKNKSNSDLMTFKLIDGNVQLSTFEASENQHNSGCNINSFGKKKKSFDTLYSGKRYFSFYKVRSKEEKVTGGEDEYFQLEFIDSKTKNLKLKFQRGSMVHRHGTYDKVGGSDILLTSQISEEVKPVVPIE